ncbi:MAG: glycosyltransferase family 4 protein [Ruminococcaceae bacterium]|nr:glycosyltransferase family 4 protein [Oscillospiraceae bacterium]
MDNKDNMVLPKVLVVNINVWQDNSAIRTMPEIFACWQKDRVAQIYTRAGLPDTKVCDEFLRINENAVIKSIINRKVKTAQRVYNTKSSPNAQDEELKKEQKRYKLATKKQSWFLSIARDVVWSLGKWKTKELNAFLDEVDADVLFMPIYPVVYMGKLQRYIAKYTGKPVACYLADDNFSYKVCGKNLFARIHRFWLRKVSTKLIKECDKLFVIVPKTKEECKEIFSKDTEYLTKAIDFSKVEFVEKEAKLPLKMTYTGKLIIGRDKALMNIAEAVSRINEDEERIRFEVYAPNEPDEKFLEAFSGKGCEFKGSIPKEEVDKVLEKSDILVFAESLDKKHFNAARLSFSTKITDYFKSGKCIFALGSKDIAPMDYLIKEDAAVTVTDYKDIEAALRKLCDNPDMVGEYGKKAFDCGRRNHNAEDVFGNFKKIMCELAE